LHGEPFRGEGKLNPSRWGGYCNHGNALFPTWHRAYLLALEKALQSIDGCEDVALPFWDETSDASLKHGLPWAFTNETFKLDDGTIIPNPLLSYKIPIELDDEAVSEEGHDISKTKDYDTVRYPLSGLVATKWERTLTSRHNKHYLEH
jgi:tyrosinase